LKKIGIILVIGGILNIVLSFFFHHPDLPQPVAAAISDLPLGEGEVRYLGVAGIIMGAVLIFGFGRWKKGSAGEIGQAVVCPSCGWTGPIEQWNRLGFCPVCHGRAHTLK